MPFFVELRTRMSPLRRSLEIRLPRAPSSADVHSFLAPRLVSSVEGIRKFCGNEELDGLGLQPRQRRKLIDCHSVKM
jgi:hypothetical protein